MTFTPEQRAQQEELLDIFIDTPVSQDQILDKHYLRGLFYDYRDMIMEHVSAGDNVILERTQKAIEAVKSHEFHLSYMVQELNRYPALRTLSLSLLDRYRDLRDTVSESHRLITEKISGR